MSEKIAINSKRLSWCLKHFDMDMHSLSKRVNIAQSTLTAAEVFMSIKQLEKVADLFGRGLLFFIEPHDVTEDTIYSAHFRTLNNQKANLSIEVKKMIERIEKQREIYISLLEDLEEPISKDWQNHRYGKEQDRTKFAESIRQWLCVDQNNDFNSLRHALESKGIMVILTNGYKGKWHIDKEYFISGFSLYYEKLPVIVVKKEHSKERQSSTLLHELAHILMHNESMIDEYDDFFSHKGKEKEANEFAGKVLVPDNFLSEIETSKLQNLDFEQYDTYLDSFKKQWGASRQLIMMRLLQNKSIASSVYNKYQNFKQFKQKEYNNKVPSNNNKEIPRVYRHKEPLRIFGRHYTNCVFDAFSNKHITLYKASTYLDNLRIDQLKRLQHELQF